MVSINRTEDDDLQHVVSLLHESALPTEGVAEHFENYFVAKDAATIVGCAGLEIFDDVGLIRSVAVLMSHRGQGIGRKLVETIHNFSVEKGLKEIYLLTETAEDYFSNFEYTIIPREEANPKVKKSIEFISACPASAVCMVKKLN
ncbi:MAG: GNAT family N-acetyltransferase [Candidatus Heimdallarchaeota archaeon]|nr:MAG: GNAT family N-acetyltransferase [Candidatus Heimdallarchaeota archaeon]